MSGPEPIRVLLVDDHRVITETLAAVVEAQEDLTCVGTAGTVSEMLDLVDEHQPDVVLTDVWLPGMDGIEGTRRLLQRHPGVRVVAFSGDADDELRAAAAAAGVTAFVPKDSPLPAMVDAIRAAAGGLA
ncbi:MAG TPA: response regulator transcription factor [Acidimicrobiales bacterium]|nr:response regulator transcription factor [Acidimicrobiales bacterium]